MGLGGSDGYNIFDGGEGRGVSWKSWLGFSLMEKKRKGCCMGDICVVRYDYFS